MILRAAAASDVGLRRKANEDCYALSPELGLYLVADGMGGHSAGQVASAQAAETALEAVQALDGTTSSLAEKLRYSVAAANRAIFIRSAEDPELNGMGTTFVAILARDGRAALAHVGDSRAYLIRGGDIRRLTDDHSIVGELLRRQEISEDAAREHPHRHVLTRALGVRRSVEPDLVELSPVLGDVFVLCSDGLTNHVEDQEIAKTIRDQSDLQEATQCLIDLANHRGGDDNTTVLTLRCED